jgi:dicarboxylate transporter DctA-like protein
MIRSRYFLICLGLALLAAVGAGFYLYQNLPELLRLQAQRYLQQYGVEDIAFERLRIAHNEASVASLKLAGTYENYTYTVQLESVELHYDWRILLGGKVDDLSATSLAIAIKQTGEPSSREQGELALDTLLPQRLVEKLPLESLSVPLWSLDYQAPQIPPLTASGSVYLNDQLDAQLSTTLAGRDLKAELQADTNTGDSRVSVSLAQIAQDTDSQQQAIAALSATLVLAEDGNWQWDVQSRLEHTAVLSWLRDVNQAYNLALGIPPAAELSVQGESHITAQIEHGDELTLAAGDDSALALPESLQASFQLSSDIRQLTIQGLADAVTTAATIDGNIGDGRVQVALQPFKLTGELPTPLLTLPTDWVQWLELANTVPAALEIASPLLITSLESGQWSVKANNALVTLGDKDSRISLQKLNLEAAVNAASNTADNIEATTILSTVLSTRVRRQTFPSLQVALSQSGSAANNTFSLHLADTAESLDATLEGSHSLTTKSGDVQLNAQITDLAYFWTSVTPLLRHFKLLQDEVDIRSGAVRLDTALIGKTYDIAHWQQRSQLTLENIAGTVNTYDFEGLSLNAGWSGIERWKTSTPLELALARLAVGFEIKDIQLHASLPNTTPVAQPRVRIDAFSADMFGGQIRIPEVQHWDFAASSNSITVQAKQWQLGELAALQPNAEIRADGVLEGELPLTIANGRVIVKDGYLRALPPGGSIRYNPNDEARALAGSNPELQLALNLLSDFQYQVLSTEVALDKEGNLLLGLSLEGSNPAQYQGQAVNFNINVEQNLDPLLQSLRLSDNLLHEIEGGLK